MQNLLRLNPEEVERLNKPINKIESVIKHILVKKSLGPDSFIYKFYQYLKRIKTDTSQNFQKNKKKSKWEKILSNSFIKSNITLTPKLDKNTEK